MEERQRRRKRDEEVVNDTATAIGLYQIPQIRVLPATSILEGGSEIEVLQYLPLVDLHPLKYVDLDLSKAPSMEPELSIRHLPHFLEKRKTSVRDMSRRSRIGVGISQSLESSCFAQNRWEALQQTIPKLLVTQASSGLASLLLQRSIQPIGLAGPSHKENMSRQHNRRY